MKQGRRRVFTKQYTLLRLFLAQLSEEKPAGGCCSRLSTLAGELKRRLPSSLDYPLDDVECGQLKARLEELGAQCIGRRLHDRIGEIVVHFEEVEDALWP